MDFTQKIDATKKTRTKHNLFGRSTFSKRHTIQLDSAQFLNVNIKNAAINVWLKKEKKALFCSSQVDGQKYSYTFALSECADSRAVIHTQK